MYDTEDIQKIWDNTLTKIKETEDISETGYQSWFLPLKAYGYKNCTIYLVVENGYVANRINEHYYDLICRNLSAVTKGEFTDFSCKSNAILNEKKKITDSKEREHHATNLNPNYNFNNFVVGDSNAFAYQACLSVSEISEFSFNPLFIQGACGTGKTHLLHAIGNDIEQNNSSKKILYISIETLTDQWNSAQKTNSMETFRSKFQNLDLLLIDDFQFLANKEDLQEEFFKIFNALYEKQTQIVIASDRLPYEIPTLEERIITRCLWGVTANLEHADYETRIGILREKAKGNNIIIPNKDNEVYSYLAKKFDSNTRILEGALYRVAAYAKMKLEPISLELTKEATKNYFPQRAEPRITIEQIQKTTAEYFDVDISNITSPHDSIINRTPYKIAMYLCRELTKLSPEEIATKFNCHYPAIISTNHKTIAKQIKTDNLIKTHINTLINIIKEQ